jgi:hypothetical protein
MSVRAVCKASINGEPIKCESEAWLVTNAGLLYHDNLYLVDKDSMIYDIDFFSYI